MWSPKTDGAYFIVAIAGGVIMTYKKSAVVGEPSSKFSLGLGSNKKDATPVRCESVGVRCESVGGVRWESLVGVS